MNEIGFAWPNRELMSSESVARLRRRERAHPQLEVPVAVGADRLAAALDDGVGWVVNLLASLRTLASDTG